MTAITIVGAGSVVFTRTIVSDLLQHEATRDCELRLCDTNPEALKAAERLVAKMREEARAVGSTFAYSDFRDSVRGTDYVVCTILVGGREAAVRDFELTARYGLRFTVGDTLGVAGISRALRTVPAVLKLTRACEELAPEALFLNYTNPMAMIVSAIGRSSRFPSVGLCHSAEHTALTLAEYLRVPPAELRWYSAGTNHLAWVLELTLDGRDLYPALAVAATQQDIYDRDRVRFELMKRVGYFVTESSKHVAEYVPFFIDKPSEIERLAIPVGEFLTRQPIPIGEQLARARAQGRRWLKPVSNEYAPALIAARESGGDWAFQGNVMNDGIVDNLSQDMSVEVPCFVSRGRLLTSRVGRLPSAAAAVTQQAITVQELAVEAILNHDRDLLYEAVMMDPQAAATLTLAEMQGLVDDLLQTCPQGTSFSSRRLVLFNGVPSEQAARQRPKD